MELQQRFESLLRTMEGLESVDTLLSGSPHETRKRADYLLWNRRVIVEQKVLLADQAHRPQRFIDRLMAQGRFLLYGQLSSDAIFRGLPDGEELKRDMFLSMTKSLEDTVAAADKQTRDTRAIFSIPNAVGMLVILNEGAPSLVPELIRFGLSHVFTKKREEDGLLRYPHNDGVIVISSTHWVPDPKREPWFWAFAPKPRSRAVVKLFSQSLLRGWALTSASLPRG